MHDSERALLPRVHLADCPRSSSSSTFDTEFLSALFSMPTRKVLALPYQTTLYRDPLQAETLSLELDALPDMVLSAPGKPHELLHMFIDITRDR